MLLENKNAVVYGAGPIGAAVARAFAREGARVFLAGRTQARLKEVADDISAAGGAAEAAVVDCLDGGAVDEHIDAVARKVGGIHVSFTAIGHGDVHGVPLVEIPYEDFARPITTAMKSQFLTATAAARHMVEQGSGVILAITATTARLANLNVGGTGVTFDAIESLCRQLAVELGPRGVRVAWLQTTGIPEAFKETGEPVPDYGQGNLTPQEHVAWITGQTMLGRLTTLADVANAAAYLASDRAGAITASSMNLTAGAVATR